MAYLQEVTSQNVDDVKRLEKWRNEFIKDFDHFKKWLVKKKDWENFYDGDQLSQEEKSELSQRKQPEVVINLIAPRIDAAIGDFLGRRVMMRAKDRGSGDFEKAKYITEALRYVEDLTEFSQNEYEVAKNLFISGLGWYKIHLEFDFLEPEIRISHKNYNDVILDRNSKRMDMTDAKRLWETMWVEVEDLIDIYPDYEKEIRGAIELPHSWDESPLHSTGMQTLGDDYAKEGSSADSGSIGAFTDPNRKCIRLINCWERVQKRIEFAFHPSLDGQVANLSDMKADERSDFQKIYPDAQHFIRTRWELNSGIWIYNTLLEYKENIRPHDSEGKFPFARAIAKTEHQSRIPYGLVKQYIDAQKEYNKRRSKLLHKTNTNRILMEEGAVADVERARVEAARPDGTIVIKPQRKFEISGNEPAQSDVFMLQLAQAEVSSVGVAREFTGQEDSKLSGNAIQLRQVAADRMIRHLYDSLRFARKQAFNLALEEMQQYWTSQKLISITDDPNAQQVILNQRVVDPISGHIVILNNLRLGKYDIKIDEDLETPNQRQENFDQLIQLADAITKLPPQLAMAIVKSSNLPMKQELLDQMLAEQERQMQILQMQVEAQARAQADANAQVQSQQNETNPRKGSNGSPPSKGDSQQS